MWKVSVHTCSFIIFICGCSRQGANTPSHPTLDSSTPETRDAGSDTAISRDAKSEPAVEKPVEEEPDPFAFCGAGFSEQCVETEECPEGPCAPGLLCDRGLCLGNVGWPCESHSECAEAFRCRDDECDVPGCVGRNNDQCSDWCGDSEECEEEAVCSARRCRYPLGHWCPNSDWCAAGLTCSDFHCRVPSDGICTEHADCPWYRLCLDHDGDDEQICTTQIEGGPCRFDRQCAAGYACEDICMTAEGVVCSAETCETGYRCVPIGDDQHRCLFPTLGGGCDEVEDCPAGTDCVENRCGYPLFAPCAESNECHPELVCDETVELCLRQEGAQCGEGECAEPFRCRPTLLADDVPRCLEPQIGNPCVEDGDEDGDCPATTSCRGGRCVRGIGESCERGAECEEGVAVCQPAPDPSRDCYPLEEAPLECRERQCYLVDSAPCADDGQCGYSLNCVPQNPAEPLGAHLCRPRIPGIGCDDASECPALVSCTSHICAMGPGETCSDARPCADGLTCHRDALPCTTARRCLPICEQEDTVSGGDHLFMSWAHVIDPGENCDDDAHIYYEIYSCDVPLEPFDPTEAQTYLLQEKRELPGPHLTEGGLYEWRCDEWMTYDDTCALAIYQWQPGQDCVVLRFYESDSCHNCPDYAREEFPWGCCCFGCDEYCFLFWCFDTIRTHDTIFLERIYRSETESPCGQTYEGHYCGRCDEGSCYPCYADGNLAVELNVQTITP